MIQSLHHLSHLLFFRGMPCTLRVEVLEVAHQLHVAASSSGKIEYGIARNSFSSTDTIFPENRSHPGVLSGQMQPLDPRMFGGATQSDTQDDGTSVLPKGSDVWYLHRSGTWQPARVIAVDETMLPAFYQVLCRADILLCTDISWRAVNPVGMARFCCSH